LRTNPLSSRGRLAQQWQNPSIGLWRRSKTRPLPAAFYRPAEQEKYIYYVMEAFDQPWKSVTEGAVGAYWGVFDVKRQPKFSLTSPIVEIPEWRTLAAISVAIAVITLHCF